MKYNYRFNRTMNGWFYGIFILLFFSGAAWLAAHYLAPKNADFDDWTAIFKSRALSVHGAAAMAALMMLGALIPMHMHKAWGKKRNRVTAIAMISLCGLMIASGYGLYYSGSDQLRTWLSWAHNVSGILFPLALLWHILSGKQERNRRD